MTPDNFNIEHLMLVLERRTEYRGKKASAILADIWVGHIILCKECYSAWHDVKDDEAPDKSKCCAYGLEVWLNRGLYEATGQ